MKLLASISHCSPRVLLAYIGPCVSQCFLQPGSVSRLERVLNKKKKAAMKANVRRNLAKTERRLGRKLVLIKKNLSVA